MSDPKIVDVVTGAGDSYRADARASEQIRGVTVERLEAGFPAVEFVWAARIPKSKVTVFAGAGAAGKSSLLTGLAIARAIGHGVFLGAPISAGSTLFVSAEDHEIDYWRRAAAWISAVREDHRASVRQAVASNVKVLNLIGTNYRLVSGKFNDIKADETAAGGIVYAASLLNPTPSLIILETVSRFGGDESNAAHSALILACEMIATRTGAAVVLVSHRGKANVREGLDDAYSARGGSALVDNARSAIVLGHMPSDEKRQKDLLGRPAITEERDLLVLTTPKPNFAPLPHPIFMQKVSTPDGLVLKRYEVRADVSAAMAEVSSAARAQRGAQLRAAVVALLPEGTIGFRKLKERIDLLPAISQRNLKQAIEHAIVDGFLMWGPAGARGVRPIMPGPVGAPGAVEVRNGNGANGVANGAQPEKRDPAPNPLKIGNHAEAIDSFQIPVDLNLPITDLDEEEKRD